MFDYTTADKFIGWLYGIGFAGIRHKGQDRVEYRSFGARTSVAPAVDATTSLVVHPTYREALGLQDKIIGSLDESLSLQKQGILIDLPEAIDLKEYNESLTSLLNQIDGITHGREHDSAFEDWVGEVIRLCFFRALTNLEPQKRDVEGHVRRDWIAANRGSSGFWERCGDDTAQRRFCLSARTTRTLKQETFNNSRII